jgi:hypothetical protein
VCGYRSHHPELEDADRLPPDSVTMVGTAVAIRVLLDTLVVRTVLSPVLLISVGDRSQPSRPPGRMTSSSARRTLAPAWVTIPSLSSNCG